MKKFYIVNDYKDLLSGKVIPHKVLDHLPMGNIGPMFQPIPITKHTGLTISSESPVFPMVSPFGYDPYSNVSITRTPLVPGFGSSVSTFGSNRIYGSNGMYGPPIIKLSPFMNQGMVMNQGMAGTIKIISDTNVFTLNVPFGNLRNVVNYIYLNAQTNIDQTKPKVTFRIITPTIDSSVSTTYDKMIDIIRYINANYANVTYLTPDGRQSNIHVLLQTLLSLLEKRSPSYRGPGLPITSTPPSLPIQIINKGGFLFLDNTNQEKQLLNDISGSGIIPYYKDTTNVLHFLLGYNQSRKLWTLFGGNVKTNDRNPRETAYRSLVEKTCKMPNMSDCYLTIGRDMISTMENGNGLCVSVEDNGKRFNIYFIQIDKPQWISKYGNTFVNIPSGQIMGNEINKIEWLTFAQVKSNDILPLNKRIFETPNLVTKL